MSDGAADALDQEADDYEVDGFDSDFELGALERAQAAVERLKESYIAEWGPAALAEMYDMLAGLGRPGGDRAEGIETFYRYAHDMKGQGGTFGYPLLTHIGEILCRLTADRRDVGESDLRILRSHLDAARHIMVQRLDGDGGDEGDRLIRDLQGLVRQHLH